MKIKLPILVCVLFFFQLLHSLAQIHIEMKKINVDSLLQIIPDLEGTKRIDARNRFAFALCSDFPDSSIAIVNNTIAISKKLEYQKGLADAYFNLGNSYFFMDSIKPMVLNYLHALRLYEDLEPSIETGLTLYQLTIVNRLTGRYEKAISYCRKALQVYRLLGEYQHEIDATYVLGGIFRRMDNRDSSLFYYDKALEILEKYPNNFLLGSVYNDYGLFYLIESWQGNKSEELLQEGIQWFFKCWELDKKHHHPAADMATPIYNIGSFYLSTGTNENINKGLAHLMLAKSIVDTAVSNIHTELMVYRQLARIEKRKGHINEAIALYNTGISKADNDMAKFSIRNYHDPQMAYADEYYTRQYKGMCYEELFEIYREIGDYKAALEYFILSEKATEEIYLEENSRLIAILEADSETEKIQSRIDMLAKDNELKTLKIDQSRTFNYGLAGMIIILVLVGLLFLRQNKMKNEHKTVLLEQKLLRLQMNPHFIFNALSNILNFIDGKENAKASNYLTTFSKLLRTTLESTRQDLVPFEKEVGSLKNYLELQKLRYGNKFDYAIEVDEGIDEEDLSIPPMLVQPFIENAIEHGIRHKKTPGRIDVRFFLVGKKILCEVEDDGVGREKAWETEVTERSGHKSLATEIIKDRIKTLNKKFRQKIQLEIIDKKSETLEALGTKVVLDIPYA